MTLTEDPTTWIVEQGEAFVVYENTDGDRWTIRGACNQCGQCEVPAPHIVFVRPIGEPGACVDLRYGSRLDVPVRPEIREKCPACSLNGEYLKRHGIAILS